MRELNGALAALNAGLAAYLVQAGGRTELAAFLVGTTVFCALVCLKPKD